MEQKYFQSSALGDVFTVSDIRRNEPNLHPETIITTLKRLVINKQLSKIFLIEDEFAARVFYVSLNPQFAKIRVKVRDDGVYLFKVKISANEGIVRLEIEEFTSNISAWELSSCKTFTAKSPMKAYLSQDGTLKASTDIASNYPQLKGRAKSEFSLRLTALIVSYCRHRLHISSRFGGQ